MSGCTRAWWPDGVSQPIEAWSLESSEALHVLGDPGAAPVSYTLIEFSRTTNLRAVVRWPALVDHRGLEPDFYELVELSLIHI